MNKGLSVRGTIGISLACALVVVGIAWWFRLPLAHGVSGLATLGTLLGAIAVLGGLITALIGVFTLSSIDERILSATAKENARRNHELDERWSQYAFALEKYWAALNESDLVQAGKYMDEAYQLSDQTLTVAAYGMFQRYWEATKTWAWDQIDPANLSHYQATIGVTVNVISPTSVVEQYGNATSGSGKRDYSADCIKWGERALGAATLPNPASLHLQLAQAYALQGKNGQALAHLRDSLSSNPDQIFHRVQDWAFLFWNWDNEDTVGSLLKILGKERIQVTPAQVEQWAAAKASDIYQGTMAPVIALQNSATRNTKLTVYSVGSFGPEGNKVWRIQHGSKSIPPENGWNLDRVVTYINANFETLGRIE